MASHGGNTLPLFGLLKPFTLLGSVLALFLTKIGLGSVVALLRSIGLFCYACFFKAHDGDGKTSQQDALESFYKSQASIYDSTRTVLLNAREDMLALAAAQVTNRTKEFKARKNDRRRVWVDVGGGTGWNIEVMARFGKMNDYDRIYLVDFSPSLCEVARARFERLGWKNVEVVCMDARKFQLKDFEPQGSDLLGASLITMSYSLSMMPDFHSIVDSIQELLADDGIIAVVDFYVQSSTDISFRDYTGGMMNRHVNMFSRMFWRTWFEFDRVCLEPARRDYLEYKFGTILSISDRNWKLGAIPYYVWVGCQKGASSLSANGAAKIPSSTNAEDAKIDSSSLIVKNPLPPYFYQRHHWRLPYDDRAKKHTQFGDEYIYAFTWEDSAVDNAIFELNSDDEVLAITSAGDNILSYLRRGPAKVHAVDLNPNQNHLLELKVAAFSILPYEDFWKIFGEGKHPEFRSLLLLKLSPYLSSRAFQYWFHNHTIFSRRNTEGLYLTGGSRWAIRIFSWLTQIFGLRPVITELLSTKTTVSRQIAIWNTKIRPMLLSPFVQKFIVSQKKFLWTALGVPRNQLAIIESEHAVSDAVLGTKTSKPTDRNTTSHAIWRYVVDTFDPVIEHTSIATDNPYYHVCLARRYAKHCHPEYLSATSHSILSTPGAFSSLQIHTDEVQSVLARLTPDSLTVAVLMDSMDWFDADDSSAAAETQIKRLHRALKVGGRVMIRSAGLRPWYLETFKLCGFDAQQVGERKGGKCIDRVNMYASCWILTKRGVITNGIH